MVCILFLLVIFLFFLFFFFYFFFFFLSFVICEFLLSWSRLCMYAYRFRYATATFSGVSHPIIPCHLTAPHQNRTSPGLLYPILLSSNDPSPYESSQPIHSLRMTTPSPRNLNPTNHFLRLHPPLLPPTLQIQIQILEPQTLPRRRRRVRTIRTSRRIRLVQPMEMPIPRRRGQRAGRVPRSRHCRC